VTTLVALLVGTAALSWGALRVAESLGAALPQLAWTAPTFLAVLAAAVLVVALALRSRLGGDRPPNPLGTARMAVLGKASAHVGPIVGGLYAGYLLVLLPAVDVESRRDRALLCAAAILAAVLLAAAGLFLERTCRIRGGDDSDPPQAPAV
jgi:hypothetical protein